MKLSNLLLFAGAAAVSYQIVKNREKLTEEVSETGQLINQAQASLANIQSNLDYLKNQKGNINDISKDLQYKLKVFNQEAQAHLAQITDIWENSPLLKKEN